MMQKNWPRSNHFFEWLGRVYPLRDRAGCVVLDQTPGRTLKQNPPSAMAGGFSVPTQMGDERIRNDPSVGGDLTRASKHLLLASFLLSFGFANPFPQVPRLKTIPFATRHRQIPNRSLLFAKARSKNSLICLLTFNFCNQSWWWKMPQVEALSFLWCKPESKDLHENSKVNDRKFFKG